MVYLVSEGLVPPVSAPDEVRDAVGRAEFEGKLGQVVEAFPTAGPRVFVVGIGSEPVTKVTGQKAGTAVLRRLQAAKCTAVHIDPSGVDGLRAAGEGFGVAFGLSNFVIKAFRGSGTADCDDLSMDVAATDEEFDKGLSQGLALGTSVNESRRLSNTPPNVATPYWMAEQAETMARSVGLDCRVIKSEELADEWMTGLINVGQASVNKPCFIRLAWSPPGSEEKAPVVLLGKTITYDTGGLSIKTKTGMPGMKYDKSGGCAVFGAMHAVATVLKPDFPVVGLLVAAENSINENAMRPDDVITYRNGVTVEVTNTDAEGRLVLADGLCWAEEVEKAAAVVDLATLTGGVVTALGSVYAGAFSRHDDLWAELDSAGKSTGEILWRLPLHETYSKNMQSKVADIVNSVPDGKAHPVMGATFLANFVTAQTPWCHIDIAGVARADGDEFTDQGPTGFGVRLLVEWLSARR